MSENTKTFVKKFNTTLNTLGESLKSAKFDEAYDASVTLNDLIKDEDQVASLSDKDKVRVLEVKEILRKYSFLNREFRKYRGSLVKKGDEFLSKL